MLARQVSVNKENEQSNHLERESIDKQMLERKDGADNAQKQTINHERESMDKQMLERKDGADSAQKQSINHERESMDKQMIERKDFADNAQKQSINHERESLYEGNEILGFSDIACEKRKYLVYLCRKGQNCNGWGDRQKGIISTFMLAQLTKRYFVMAHDNPCELSDFLVPNTYKWKSCYEYVFTVPESQRETLVYFNNDNTFTNNIATTDFDVLFKKQVIFIITNQIWNHAILIHPKTAENIPWTVTKTNWEINGFVLNSLFRPSQDLEKDIRKYIDNVSKQRTLVCSHIRVGKNPSMPQDQKRYVANVTTIFQFLKGFDNLSKYVIYVASDSQAVRDNVKGNFTNSFIVDSPIVHVARLRPEDDACEGFRTVLLEQCLLARCDILLYTRSSFSRMAAYMNYRSKGLYYFDPESKSVVIKTRSTEQLFHIRPADSRG